MRPEKQEEILYDQRVEEGCWGEMGRQIGEGVTEKERETEGKREGKNKEIRYQ